MSALDWDSLLRTDRLRLDTNGQLVRYQQAEEPPRTPAEADIQRIIFSSPFRRLAGKTQVHPLAKVDYVHNRLTHSLEVAEIGTSLTQRLAATLEFSPERATACAYHVKAACLGHDIGNPPYGHAGEFAIQSWVDAHREELGNLLAEDDEVGAEGSAEAILEDLLKFDGNAQAFRLLSHPEPRRDAYFRLSCASLGALIKYPRCSNETATAKFSCFYTARPCFALVTDTLGLRTETGIKRHPLSYLTEIADDICYCVTDCEDAVLMGILDEERVRNWYLDLLDAPATTTLKEGASLSFLRARVIGDLVRCFTDELATAFDRPEQLDTFEQTSPTWQRLQTLKRNYRIVFDDAAKIRKELHAQAELHRTLDAFLSVLQLLRCDNPGYSAKLLRKYAFGEHFVEANRQRPYQWWIHTVLDFVTGMTDHYLHRFTEILR